MITSVTRGRGKKGLACRGAWLPIPSGALAAVVDPLLDASAELGTEGPRTRRVRPMSTSATTRGRRSVRWRCIGVAQSASCSRAVPRRRSSTDAGSKSQGGQSF